MDKRIRTLEDEAMALVSQAQSEEDLEKVRVRYLGRKGELTLILRGLSSLPESERREAGRQANLLKKKLEEAVSLRRQEIRARRREEILQKDWIDITLPGRPLSLGSLHPITIVLQEIINIFTRLGFEVAEGPEVELDYYNFEALNIPKDHPARDMQDTFYISEEVLLRTHTSPVQIRVMEAYKPPIRIIAPGKVYRRDTDISHSPMFHQVEGFMVDEQVSFSDLKGVLEAFSHQMFGPDVRLRFRPSFFPFTEPSAEVDITCVICQGSGCRVCSQTGWLEILGSGMIHPGVFKVVGCDPEAFTGFAFGMGVERIAMLKFGIDDIRLFFENDLRFLRQFHTP